MNDNAQTNHATESVNKTESIDNDSRMAADQILKNTRQIWPTPGGVHPPEHKAQSLQLPLAELDIPAELIYPLSQHVGAPAQAVVDVGDYVLSGQLIASAEENISANIHVASSGIVTAIEARPSPHPSGLLAPCIVIETDGKDQWVELEPCEDFRKLQPIEVLEKIKAAGVVGMGGAGFPTAVKLSPNFPISTLIINGTECEPYITSDDTLMRTQSEEIIAGAMMLSYLLGEPKDILLAIEDNKPEAITAMKQAVASFSVAHSRIDVVALPNKYPSGGEKQLIQMLTGKEVPSGRLPAHVGTVCQNIASVVAAYRAVTLGEPLVSRITTVTGEAFEAQRNIKVRLGTPIHHILRTHGYDAEKASRLVIGGPMMGFTLLSDRAPVIKTTNCILAPSKEEVPSPPPAQACIRCGMCSEACPASLLPQQLYWYARAQEYDKLNTHNLFDCIECGACSYACPSHIPLVQYYRAAKSEIRQHSQEKLDSDRSRKRFEFHKERIEKEKQERIRAREEAAEKAKQRKAAKALEQQKKQQTEAGKLPTEGKGEPIVDNKDQLAKLERSLLSNNDKLEKLNTELQESESSAPQKADALRAKIKGVELKITNLQKKITGLKAPTPQATSSPQVPPSQTLGSEVPESGQPELEAQKIDQAVNEAPTKKISLAVLKLKERLAETEAKLAEAQEQEDEESVIAFNMSINILKERLHEAEQKDTANDGQVTTTIEKHQATKSAVEKAMERVLNDRGQSDADNLRQQIDSLQERLQNAQTHLKSTELNESNSTNVHSIAELAQAVELLESKLSGAFEKIEEEKDNNS